jgi:hypothetical protein
MVISLVCVLVPLGPARLRAASPAQRITVHESAGFIYQTATGLSSVAGGRTPENAFASGSRN